MGVRSGVEREHDLRPRKDEDGEGVVVLLLLLL
jgi:hypothetical protein